MKRRPSANPGPSQEAQSLPRRKWNRQFLGLVGMGLTVFRSKVSNRKVRIPIGIVARNSDERTKSQ